MCVCGRGMYSRADVLGGGPSWRLSWLLWLTVCLWSAVGCRDATPAPDTPWPAPIREEFQGEYPIRAVATVGMVGEMVREVGGSYVQVDALCGPGVDPHLFKPTRDHVARLLQADLVVYSGLHLEGKLQDTLLRISARRPVYSLAQGLDAQRLLVPVSEEQGRATDMRWRWENADPHIWMDVELWSTAIQGLVDCLSSLDPKHATEYAENGARYRSRLLELHQEGQRLMAGIPVEKKVLVTSHDAFRYFGRAYGIQVEGVQGLSTESEAGLSRINELADMLIERRIPAVFVESSISEKNMIALMEGVASRGWRLRLGGSLYADSMGVSGTPEATYTGMMLHNFSTIAQQLTLRDDSGVVSNFDMPTTPTTSDANLQRRPRSITKAPKAK